MGTFTEHIQQAKQNLSFLSSVNENINDRWDWQVTVCFYSAVHLINAHIVSKTSKNYLTHGQVSGVINPYADLSLGKLDEKTYTSYTKLFHLSRRSRYLLNENFDKSVDIQTACLTYDKHFKKAIHHLDIVIEYIKANYSESFGKEDLTCLELKGRTFSNFNIL